MNNEKNPPVSTKTKKTLRLMFGLQQIDKFGKLLTDNGLFDWLTEKSEKNVQGISQQKKVGPTLKPGSDPINIFSVEFDSKQEY